MDLLWIISIFWFISEAGLSYIKKASIDSKDVDKSSLKILWIVIGGSVGLGIFLGMASIGFVNFYRDEAYISGIILICLGLALRWVAIFQLKKHFTVNVSIRKDHQLIQSGLYKYIRHPAYSGGLLSFFGLGLAFDNWLSLLIICLPITLAFFYRISIEEAELSKAFGEKYDAYKKQTKRLIPRVY